MLKEAIEKIEAMSKSQTAVVDGHNYIISGSEYAEIKPELIYSPCITLSSLDAVVQMVKTELCKLHSFAAPLFIQIPSYNMVRVFTAPQKELREQRINVYDAKAVDVPGFDDDTTLNFDAAMIALRTRFQHSADIDYALKLLNDLTTGSKVTYNDNGVATSVVTKTGVALQSNQAIRPIIKLRPYRTFQEVEQPESEFLIRINERGIRFVEADGGMWRLHARNNIKAWLVDKLSAEMESGDVVITL